MGASGAREGRVKAHDLEHGVGVALDDATRGGVRVAAAGGPRPQQVLARVVGPQRRPDGLGDRVAAVEGHLGPDPACGH